MKDSYKIPASLADGYGSMEIALSTKDGSVARIFQVKIILAAIVSLFGFFICLTRTFIAGGTVGQKIVFTILWLAWSILLIKIDKTNRMNVQKIITLLSYVPKKARYVFTRKSSKVSGFYGISNISDIGDKGLIHFNDDTYGYLYRVVGSASILLFEGDKKAIISRVDSFYRKQDTNVEIIFMTSKESQKVFRQLANLQEMYDKLEIKNPELQDLMEEQFAILKNEVGGSYKSVHQYLFLKADNKESLTRAKNVLQSEIENSALMIKQCVPLIYKEDIYEVFASVFKL